MWPALVKVFELATYRKCPVYKPAPGDTLPAYFYSMLDDVDRLLQYSEAIRACIQSLPAGQRMVLDLGVGTGMLSALCIHHGAERVVGVDVNQAALDAAEGVMASLGFSDRFVKLKVAASASTASLRIAVNAALSSSVDQPFDAVVSEILGTLWYGESMRTFVLKYMPLVKLHAGTVHCVPVRCTQYFGIYEFNNVSPALRDAVTYALQECEDTNEYVPTDKGGIGVALHLYDYANVRPKVRVCECNFAIPTAPMLSERPSITLESEASASALRLGVFEWECELWNGVMLNNTLDAYKRIGQTYGERYALARQSAWGVMICRASEACSIQLKFTIGACVEVDIEASTYGCTLNDVAIDKHGWICSAADTRLAPDITSLLQHESDTVDTIVHVVDDVTCGALIRNLLGAFQHASIHVSAIYYPASLSIIRKAFGDAHPRVKLISNKRKRSQLTPATFAIFPSLYHMHRDYAVRQGTYASFSAEIECARYYPNDTRSRQVDLRRTASAGPAGSLAPIANLSGSIPQMLKHANVHFTSRDFEAPPFWEIEALADFEVDLNVHQVDGTGPIANLENIQNLLRNGETAEAHGRMMSGSGLIIRIGHVNDANAEFDEASSEDDSDSDDNYIPSPKRKR